MFFYEQKQVQWTMSFLLWDYSFFGHVAALVVIFMMLEMLGSNQLIINIKSY